MGSEELLGGGTGGALNVGLVPRALPLPTFAFTSTDALSALVDGAAVSLAGARAILEGCSALPVERSENSNKTQSLSMPFLELIKEQRGRQQS